MILRIVSNNTCNKDSEQYNFSKYFTSFKKQTHLRALSAGEEDESVFQLYFYCPNVRDPKDHLNLYLMEHGDLTLLPPSLQAAVWHLREIQYGNRWKTL